jgi:hypothetical protein
MSQSLYGANLFPTMLYRKYLNQCLKGIYFPQCSTENVWTSVWMELFSTMLYRKCLNQCLRGNYFLQCSTKYVWIIVWREFIFYNALQKIFESMFKGTSLSTILYSFNPCFGGFIFSHAFHIPYNFITSPLTCCSYYDLFPLRENIGNWRINTFFKLDVNVAEETEGRPWYLQRVMTQDLAGTQHTDLSRHKIRTYPPLCCP